MKNLKVNRTACRR